MTAPPYNQKGGTGLPQRGKPGDRPNPFPRPSEKRLTPNTPYLEATQISPQVIDRFFENVEKGYIQIVKKMLDNPKMPVNHIDFQGNTVLHVAIKKNNEEMVKLLLQRMDLDVGDCLFHAIKANRLPIVKMISNRLLNIDQRYISMPCKDSADFPRYLTPLMLAAQCGHLDIIEYLFQCGHPDIPVPHEPRCLCDNCIKEIKELDPLERLGSKFETFKALCNPTYIVVISDDPIFTAFIRVEELKVWALASRIFLRKYEMLIEETELFAADIISLCRTSDEVKLLLSAKLGSEWIEDGFPFPRLLMAVDYKQHHFVAQRNVQAVLEHAWIGDWYNWRTYSNKRRVAIFFGRIFMLLVLCPVYFLQPNSSWSRFYRIPVNRMISYLASYFVFLLLLFLESNRDKKGQTRYQITHNEKYQVIIIFFVVAHIASSLRMWTVQGTTRFFSFRWNWYDMFTQLMFVMTFAFWVCALVTLDWQPDIERKYWHYLDPQLLAEGLFCIGTVMAYLRILLLIQIHHILGPMQISVGKMTKDFSKFVLIFGIVVTAFTVGMCKFYEYYDGMKQVDPETHSESRQESSFVGFYETFKVLFWGLFAMSSQESANVVIENLPVEGSELEDINTHDFTQAVGYTLFGVYMVLTVIVIMNMLIAAMSNTYQMVTDNVDSQWIYGRTEVYLIYMLQTVVPPPLSIIPAVGRICYFIFGKCLKKPVSVEETKKEEVDIAEHDEMYNKLMKKLVTRYFSYKEENSTGD